MPSEKILKDCAIAHAHDTEIRLCKFREPETPQREAFQHLRQQLTSRPVFALPNFSRPHNLDRDMSSYQFECAILQKQPGKAFSVVRYQSYCRKDTVRSYHANERECYAVVLGTTSLCP